jgi:hypothetical protein
MCISYTTTAGGSGQSTTGPSYKQAALPESDSITKADECDESSGSDPVKSEKCRDSSTTPPPSYGTPTNATDAEPLKNCDTTTTSPVTISGKPDNATLPAEDLPMSYDSPTNTTEPTSPSPPTIGITLECTKRHETCIEKCTSDDQKAKCDQEETMCMEAGGRKATEPSKAPTDMTQCVAEADKCDNAAGYDTPSSRNAQT